MCWHRLERAPGRFSLVGTTVKDPERLPPHLVADEKHTTLAGTKIDLVGHAGGGCCLGLAWAEKADQDDLTMLTACFGMRLGIWIEVSAPDGQHRRLGRNAGGLANALQGSDADPLLPPCVSEDPGARPAPEGDVRGAAGAGLGGVPRSRCPHVLAATSPVAGVSFEASRQADRAGEGASLCDKREAFVKAYAHPGCHRTSDPMNQFVHRLDYHLYCTQHLHGTAAEAEQRLRGWALIHNFAPWARGRFERLTS